MIFTVAGEIQVPSPEKGIFMLRPENGGIRYIPPRDNADNPFERYRHDRTNQCSFHIDEDNPFASFPVDTPPCMRPRSVCSFIAGVASTELPILLELASKAFGKNTVFGCQDFNDGTLVIFEDVYWNNESQNIQRLVDFLQIIAASDMPVAYACLGNGINVYANRMGYGQFHNKITWNYARHKFEFCRTDDTCGVY